MKSNGPESDYVPAPLSDIHRDIRTVPFYDVVRGQAAYLRDTLCSLALEDPDSPIDIVFSSYGGPVDESLACADSIDLARDCLREGKINGVVSGYCQSAGVFLLQLCDERTISDRSYIMVHGWMSGCNGDSRYFEADRRQTAILTAAYLPVFAARAKPPKRTKHTWDSIFADSTPIYLNAQEALEWGLVDTITPTTMPSPRRSRK